MTACEFRLICGSSRDSDREIAVVRLPSVPAVGETVGINGNPYVVHQRGWALDTEGSKRGNLKEVDLYCYLRVVKHHAFGSAE